MTTTLNKTAKKYTDIILSGEISERQIIDIRSWMAKSKENADLVFEAMDGKELSITPDQEDKGYKFLLNQWKTPTGADRKNCPFGNREKNTLENFSHITLHSFYDAAIYGGKSWYLPIYAVHGKDGSGFEYYYNGDVNIIG